MVDGVESFEASFGVCGGCGRPVLVWSVVSLGADGVDEDVLVVCETCETGSDDG